jgi:glycosyltransferase involved in cell wall biosynthesis
MNAAPVPDFPTSLAASPSISRTPKVKIAYIVGSLRDGGAERHVLQLIRNLDRQIFEPSLILMEAVNLDRAEEVVAQHFVMHIPSSGNTRWLRRGFSMARAVRSVAVRLKAWECDVVHAILPGPSILGGMAARLAGVPVMIGSRHSLVSLYRSRSGLAAVADRLAFHLADMTLGPSEAVTDEMIGLGGCPPRKSRTLYNGVDTARFRPGLSRNWRSAMGWNERHMVFGMIANFRACKGHADFVHAAALILRNHPEARFVMVGADLGLKIATENLIHELGLTETVRILDSDPAPEKIFAAIDVCISTSTSEAFGMVLAEAMACGTPVIATSVGGVPEVVGDGETGFLVPAASPAAVAAAAEKLLADPELRRSMGARGRSRVEEEFSLHRTVQAHERLYLELLGDSKRADG